MCFLTLRCRLIMLDYVGNLIILRHIMYRKKNKMTKQLLICLLMVVGLSTSSYSQSSVSPWAIGGGLSKMEYDGIRGSNGPFGSPAQLGWAGRVTKYLSPSWDVAIGATGGRHGLFDADDATNATNFEGKVWQANIAGHWKFLKGEKFNPFLSAGLGYLSFKDDSAAAAVNAIDGSGLAVPLGLGIKYNITDGFGIYWHSQYGLYLGDSYNGVNSDETDTHFVHELGIGVFLGKQDRDGDKVADKKDECPDTPGLKTLAGCPDADLDGIRDSEDACPNLPGPAEYNGCPDQDGDGVIDPDDKCPEVKGEARFNGCPDTDGDEIGDDVDECINESGLARYNGCPIPDTDGDGFNDEDDECVNVKGDLRGCPDSDDDGFHDMEDDCKDVVGTVNGCPDGDNDGIADKDDKCPDEAGVPEKDGCPLVRKPTRSEIINSWNSPDVNFVSGTRGDEDYDADVTAIVDFHKQYPDAFLHVSGYSDSQGSEASNMRISKRRAKKVYQALIKAGVPAEQLSYEGYGEANPIADNSTREGRLLNRRVSVSASTVKRVIETVGTKR